MATVKELAEEEAARAEAEEPAEAEETSDVPEEPEAPQEPADEPVDGSELAAQLYDKALNREHTRHENALAKLHGETWDRFSLCPLCMGDGFMTPHGPGDVPDEVWEAIMVFAGRVVSDEYVEDSDYEQCEHCKGHGHTKTGAAMDATPIKMCDKCSGLGYTRKAPHLPAVSYLPPAAPSAVPNPLTDFAAGPGNPDQWGRRPGHPHFGLDPNLVGVGVSA